MSEQEKSTTSAKQQPTNAKSLLSKIIEQQEHDLVRLMKTRIADYKFKGCYDAEFPESCKLKRWSYGVSIQLLPVTVGLISEVISLLSSLSNERTVEMEVNGQMVDDVFKTLASSTKVSEYANIMQRICVILQTTLDTVPQKLDVKEFELIDVIGISKLVLQQNLGVVLKNLQPAPEKTEPNEVKTNESSQ